MNRNNTKRKSIKSTLGWIVSLMLLFALTFLSVQRKSNQYLSELHVEIHGHVASRNLVVEQDIEKLIEGYLGYDIRQAKIDDIDIRELEQILNNDDRVKNADIFIDANENINVVITEKRVIVRVQDGAISYYLDENGDKIGTKLYRAIRVPIATGSIEDYSASLFDPQKDSNLSRIYKIGKAIAEDDFMSALIEHINIDDGGEVTLIPKIGRSKILLSAEELEDKITKLKYFYKDGLPKAGWSKYAALNLNYKDLVFAQKK